MEVPLRVEPDYKHKGIYGLSIFSHIQISCQRAIGHKCLILLMFLNPWNETCASVCIPGGFTVYALLCKARILRAFEYCIRLHTYQKEGFFIIFDYLVIYR